MIQFPFSIALVSEAEVLPQTTGERFLVYLAKPLTRWDYLSVSGWRIFALAGVSLAPALLFTLLCRGVL
jgi:hypothetical protein